MNACAAVAAAVTAGADFDAACTALKSFRGVKRRLEALATVNGITVYDDFAHHPTAVSATLATLRNTAVSGALHCVLEPRSNTMRLGVHEDALAEALNLADHVYLYQPPTIDWQVAQLGRKLSNDWHSFVTTGEIIESVIQNTRAGDIVVIMSNGGFEGIHRRLVGALETHHMGAA